jgi:hypothetical protein
LDAVINYKNNEKPEPQEQGSSLSLLEPICDTVRQASQTFCLLRMAVNSREVPVNGKKWVTLYFARMSEPVNTRIARIDCISVLLSFLHLLHYYYLHHPYHGQV